MIRAGRNAPRRRTERARHQLIAMANKLVLKQPAIGVH